MSDGERACLVPSKELKLEARQNFNTFQLLFIPLSFFKLLNLAVDLTASSGSTRKRHANHLVSTRGGRSPHTGLCLVTLSILITLRCLSTVSPDLRDRVLSS